MLYNRASADPEGKPWSERKRYVWWDEAERKWTGHDAPDFEVDKPPDYRPPDGAKADDAIAGDHPFIMQADGRGWLFAPAGSWTGRCRRTTSRTSRRSQPALPAARNPRASSASRDDPPTEPVRAAAGRRGLPVRRSRPTG